jgi:hypothetical protein
MQISTKDTKFGWGGGFHSTQALTRRHTKMGQGTPAGVCKTSKFTSMVHGSGSRRCSCPMMAIIWLARPGVKTRTDSIIVQAPRNGAPRDRHYLAVSVSTDRDAGTRSRTTTRIESDRSDRSIGKQFYIISISFSHFEKNRILTKFIYIYNNTKHYHIIFISIYYII